MRLSGMGPVAFFWDTIFPLGAQKPPLTQILPSTLGVKTKKKKKKKSSSKMHPRASVLLLSFGAQFSLGGHILACRHKNLLWYRFCPHICEWRLKTKQKGLYHNPNGVGPVSFFWGTHSRWGHNKLLWYGFCPLIRGWRLKTKQKGLYHYTNGVGPVVFFWGTHSCLGAQKPPLVQILPSHSRVKAKNKTKRSLSKMHPNGVGPVAFFWGTILTHLRGQHFSLVGHSPGVTSVASGLHGWLCRKFTALVL